MAKLRISGSSKIPQKNLKKKVCDSLFYFFLSSLEKISKNNKYFFVTIFSPVREGAVGDDHHQHYFFKYGPRFFYNFLNNICY